MHHDPCTDVGLSFSGKSQDPHLQTNLRIGSLLLASLIKIITMPHYQYVHCGKLLRVKNKRSSALMYKL